MAGGFIAFRCSDFDNTAEREQFRALCKMLKKKYQYQETEKMCFLIANYNIFDCEFDAILIKNDAIIAIEFKNYGGNIVAVENGDWKSNGTIIKGGSRKTVYQQARVNHAALKNGLSELGINKDWIKDLPSIVVFNKLITIENKLSNKVQSWLYITDNAHFIEKVEDITCKTTNMSNTEMVDLAIKLNLNSFIDKDLSYFPLDEHEEKPNVGEPETPVEAVLQVIDETEIDSSIPITHNGYKDMLVNYDRFTPNHIFSLRPNQIFVFGTDKRGSQKYGASGLAAKKFGAQVGLIEGATGLCYALPTKGFTINDLQNAVKRFKDYVDNNQQYTFLVTPVGCGHAGFTAKEVSSLFKDFVTYKNVMLPKVFIDEYLTDVDDSIPSDANTNELNEVKDSTIIRLIKQLRSEGKTFNESGSFRLIDEDGNVIAEAELGIESDKIVFSPFNSQSVYAFKNHGYVIATPEEYLNRQNKE